MSEKEVLEFQDLLDKGLELAEKKMLQEKALHNECVVVSSDGKDIRRIPARQIIAEHPQYQQ